MMEYALQVLSKDTDSQHRHLYYFSSNHITPQTTSREGLAAMQSPPQKSVATVQSPPQKSVAAVQSPPQKSVATMQSPPQELEVS